MRYTRIELEGPGANAFATLTRRRGGDTIDVEVLLPGTQHRHAVQVDDLQDQWSMAEGLYALLTGDDSGEITNEVRAYFDAIGLLVR